MRKIGVIALIALLFFIALGPLVIGNEITLLSIKSNVFNCLKGKHMYFLGSRSKNIKFSEDKEITFNIDAETKKGDITISLLDSNENKIFETKNPSKTEIKTIKVEKGSNYIIKIDGRKHRGSYKVSWK
ncbi:hypothetical protein CLPU_6c01550 [Gottschalkia purinilytica]|uniref:Uncharacterized protein n=1 Tax=Gottschalkia purinilytica TaxID=1503 RepID=A0A0L0WAW4_GOTPU|nr:hypothetical protein [Gottschalkia purinilytica]KNF08669.1 hypothetical protein CLPU_6c01550 [Gottschalkia purinilytica]